MKHPLPEPTLFERTCYVVAIGGALLAIAMLAGCGKRPTAPPSRADGPCTVTQRFPLPEGGTAVATLRYTVCPPDSLLAATGWRRVP